MDMLFPKKTEYKKMYRKDSYKKEFRVNRVVHGDFGIKSLILILLIFVNIIDF